MIELTLIKTQDGSFRPATAMDVELAGAYKLGQPIKVRAVKRKARSLAHLKLYFGGLLELAMDYWEPTGGLISASETHTLKQFCSWLDAKGGDSGALRRAGRAFLGELRQSRGLRIETPHKSKEALHDWIKIEAGYCDLVVTPAGVKKVAQSINFDVMDQDQFNAFYKAAFSVVWRFVLSRKFNNEAEAQAAVDQLVSMG